MDYLLAHCCFFTFSVWGDYTRGSTPLLSPKSYTGPFKISLISTDTGSKPAILSLYLKSPNPHLPNEINVELSTERKMMFAICQCWGYDWIYRVRSCACSLSLLSAVPDWQRLPPAHRRLLSLAGATEAALSHTFQTKDQLNGDSRSTRGQRLCPEFLVQAEGKQVHTSSLRYVYNSKTFPRVFDSSSAQQVNTVLGNNYVRLKLSVLWKTLTWFV